MAAGFGRAHLGDWSAAVDAIAFAHRAPDLYLLTDVNTPFEQDGTRDGEQIREWMHEVFVEQLSAHGRPFIKLFGVRRERLEMAVAAVNRAMRTLG